MDRLSDILSLLEYSFDSKEKRHIAGGILISMSLLFGSLAFTIITLRTEEEEDNG
ncbi:hypothetical protein CLOSS21_01556 [Clostridium sp. SS2/1]|nr:hypothetical protein CLOSS21_01556 [Clostridium sp. SS2/1]